MLYRPGSAPTSILAARKIEGRKLSRRRKRISPSHKALLALDLMSGTVSVSRFTGAQARVLAGASYGYVATAAKLTPEQRRLVECGLSLSAFHNRHQPTDAALDDYIIKVGADRVMEALDRYTQPQLFAAE